MFKRKKREAEPRHFTHGASGAMADAAPAGDPRPDENLPDAPYSRKVEPLGENEKPDQLAKKEAVSKNRREALLEEGLEESFPASDPVSAHHIT
ncbi:MAG TPA: hypothetical protein VG939_03180 [Caulobacteraceae bacterium]|nr:hypothetical protein [Caulobacteraceae bacterium]